MRPCTKLLFLLSGFASLAATCSQPIPRDVPAIHRYFSGGRIPDTLRFEVAEQSDTVLPGDTIPNALFFTVVPPELLREIDYLADSSSAVVMGRRHFPWNDSLEAYWVDIRQAWFQHQSLFLYNKRRQNFAARVTVAEWFGGDGGQVLTGSYLLDYDGDGQKDLIRRDIQHGLIPDGDDVREVIHESALRLLWRDGRFVELPAADSSLMVKQFPIRSFW